MSADKRSLAGKVAIVTGAGSGLGRETAKTLVDYGAQVVVADLNPEEGENTVAYIGKEKAIFIQADVTDLESVSQLVDKTLAEFGRLDIAHNNAGIVVEGPYLADVTKEQYERVMGVNLTGVFNCMKMQIPAMLKTNGGSIINTSSALGQVGIRGQSAYVASKHGVIGLTKAAALEYSSQGIRVNTVLPGVIKTAMVEKGEADHPGIIDMLSSMHPIGHLGQPEDIGEMVAFLASDAAAFITGSSFSVDGGFLAQ